MRDITYANLSQKLIEIVPELWPQYRKELESWGDEVPGPHIIYADVLTPYLMALLKSEPNSEIEEVFTRIFAFLETLANHKDVHISEVVGVSVLEPLYGAGLLERARHYMGPATLQMSREIEEWKPTKKSSVASPPL